MGSRILMTKHGDTHTVSSGAVCHICSPRDVKVRGGRCARVTSIVCHLSYFGATPVALVRLLRHVKQLSWSVALRMFVLQISLKINQASWFFQMHRETEKNNQKKKIPWTSLRFVFVSQRVVAGDCSWFKTQMLLWNTARFRGGW